MYAMLPGSATWQEDSRTETRSQAVFFRQRNQRVSRGEILALGQRSWFEGVHVDDFFFS